MLDISAIERQPRDEDQLKKFESTDQLIQILILSFLVLETQKRLIKLKNERSFLNSQK